MYLFLSETGRADVVLESDKQMPLDFVAVVEQFVGVLVIADLSDCARCNHHHILDSCVVTEVAVEPNG